MPSNLVDAHMYQWISEEAVASIILWNISRIPYLTHYLMAHPTSILLRITRFIQFVHHLISNKENILEKWISSPNHVKRCGGNY